MNSEPTKLDRRKEIRELQAENAALKESIRWKDIEISALKEQVAEVERLKADKATAVEKMHESANQFVEFMHGPHSQVATERDELRQQLAISQLEAKRLREALEEFVNGADECLDDGGWAAMVVSMEAYHICDEAISSPTSTEALDAYVAEKVKELQNELERERMRLAACGTAALGYFEGCCDEYKSASLDDTLRLYAKAEQITRQRDLAVSAIENLVKQKGRHNTEIAYKKLVEALADIKESGATK